jgi:hypothetical protein
MGRIKTALSNYEFFENSILRRDTGGIYANQVSSLILPKVSTTVQYRIQQVSYIFTQLLNYAQLFRADFSVGASPHNTTGDHGRNKTAICNYEFLEDSILRKDTGEIWANQVSSLILPKRQMHQLTSYIPKNIWAPEQSKTSISEPAALP